MTTDTRPLLYLDIDGVIAVQGRRGRPPAGSGSGAGWRHCSVWPSPLAVPADVWIRPEWDFWARTLLQHADIVWASTWRGEASRVMAPLIGLPDDLEVLSFDSWRTEGGLFGKTACVAGHAAGRPFVWIDDRIGDVDREWLASQEGVGEHLTISPDTEVGFTAKDFEFAVAWLNYGRHHTLEED